MSDNTPALRRDPAHTVGAYNNLGLVRSFAIGTAAFDIGTVLVKTAEDVWSVATVGTVTSQTDEEVAAGWWSFDTDPETSVAADGASLSVDFDRSRDYDLTADTEPGLIFRVGDKAGLEAFEVEEGLLHGVSSIVLPIATGSPVARVLFGAGWSYVRYGARCECHPDHPYSVDVNAHLR